MIQSQRQENVCAYEHRRTAVLSGICRFPGEGENPVWVSRQYVETTPEDSSAAAPCGKTRFGTGQIFATVTSGADNATLAESAQERVSA